MPEVSIRRAETTDLPGIVAVQAACPEAPHWPASQYGEMLQHEAAQRRGLFVALESGRVVGYSVAAGASMEAELESVAVLPEMRRRSVGLRLCGAAMAWAKEHGAEQMWLEVRSSSEGAQALYRRLGFREAGVRKQYYSRPDEDAVLMSAML